MAVCSGSMGTENLCNSCLMETISERIMQLATEINLTSRAVSSTFHNDLVRGEVVNNIVEFPPAVNNAWPSTGGKWTAPCLSAGIKLQSFAVSFKT